MRNPLSGMERLTGARVNLSYATTTVGSLSGASVIHERRNGRTVVQTKTAGLWRG